MCKCTPIKRTPWCGAPGCKAPVTISIDPEKLVVAINAGMRHCVACDSRGWQDELEHKVGCPLHEGGGLRPPPPITAEWDTLWLTHKAKQSECAREAKYDEAKWHMERADAILPWTQWGATKAPEVA